MIAVAPEHGDEVLLRPFIEQRRIRAVQLAFRDRPFVEGFIHDQDAQAVAEIEKFRGRRVVTAANRITTHRLEQRQSPFPYLDWHGCAHRTPIVVQAHAEDFDMLAVEEKAVVGIELDRANTEGRFVMIDDLAALRDRLAEILGCAVDLTTPQALKPRLRSRILDEVRYAA